MYIKYLEKKNLIVLMYIKYLEKKNLIVLMYIKYLEKKNLIVLMYIKYLEKKEPNCPNGLSGWTDAMNILVGKIPNWRDLMARKKGRLKRRGRTKKKKKKKRRAQWMGTENKKIEGEWNKKFNDKNTNENSLSYLVALLSNP